MPAPITIETADEIRPLVRELAGDHARRLSHVRYADIRVELGEGKGAAAENGQSKQSTEDYGFSFGVRVIAGDRAVAAGYAGRQVGAADLPNLAAFLRGSLEQAHARALANARRKADARERFGPLGASLHDIERAPIEVRQDDVPAAYEIDPRSVSLDDVTKLAKEVSAALSGIEGVVFNFAAAETTLTRLLFCSSEGADIRQDSAVTLGMAFIVAQGPEATQEIYAYTGAQRGWEVLLRGYRDGYTDQRDLMSFATALGRDAVRLASARPLQGTDRDVVVVTDPHFNALLAHEVIGHPTELDRALKMETGYAGRSWLLRDLDHTQVGQRIGSDVLSAYSDPGLPGFGHYRYDDEGTPARRVQLIEHGIFRGFMNSRETAAITRAEPNGSYKASDASLVPLIRMSNTVIAPGMSDPRAIIRDVEHGYYLEGHRTPGISESRENFRITAQKVYEIRNGELGELFRDGGIQSDTRDFFLSIDAAGADFRLFPIPNCGKGQPMQVKKLGNGGATLRGRAKLTGV